eukprot:2617285-Amphidinium_carterae.1
MGMSHIPFVALLVQESTAVSCAANRTKENIGLNGAAQGRDGAGTQCQAAQRVTEVVAHVEAQ